MKYGLYNEETGWVQEFAEYTEGNGGTKKVKFESRDEAESARAHWGDKVQVKEIDD